MCTQLAFQSHVHEPHTMRQCSIVTQAKPYKNNPEILAMTNLVQAYQNDDITEFEKILKTNRSIVPLHVRQVVPTLMRRGGGCSSDSVN